jgi:SAM-dependent methyltransferase
MTVDPTTAQRLGHPSYSWRAGQERRLNMVRRYTELEGKHILDIGCGVGTYVRRFLDFTPDAYGVDIDLPRLNSRVPNLMAADSENQPFRSATFDLVVLNEVIEHVQDDRATLRESLRLLRPGGLVVIFAPNRGYPFETHGIYWRGKYRFGNYPLVNYLPRFLRDKLVPHAGVYTHGEMRRLFRGLDCRLVEHTYVFPGFDNIFDRARGLGTLLRNVFYRLEQSPLNRLGLSHLVVLQKVGAAEEPAPRVVLRAAGGLTTGLNGQ